MTPGRICAMSGGCPLGNDADMIVRIPPLGDRALCAACVATLEQMGMYFRRLDDTTPLPEWRQRDLARDMTGKVA